MIDDFPTFGRPTIAILMLRDGAGYLRLRYWEMKRHPVQKFADSMIVGAGNEEWFG